MGTDHLIRGQAARPATDLNLRIEAASFRAWPALEETGFDGWRLRFSRGYTHRINSVEPPLTLEGDLRNYVERCESLYAAHDLPCVFRLTSLSDHSDLERLLTADGYIEKDSAVVMQRPLSPKNPPTEIRAIESVREIDDWLGLFCRLYGFRIEDQDAHRAILERISTDRILASLPGKSGAVGCGLGVVADGFLGLFSLITDPAERNRGNGAALVSGLLAWGYQHGASLAYLQVRETNLVARRLYERLGFLEAYRYSYFVSQKEPG
jgi:GNAT superfamily N-acetyltransferase